MGGEPWMIRKPFLESPERVLKRHRQDILEETQDWPDIRITDGKPSMIPGWPIPTNACGISPLADRRLVELFGTDRPQSSMSDQEIWEVEFWEDIPRGEGHYLVLYDDEIPKEICFVGYSFD